MDHSTQISFREQFSNIEIPQIVIQKYHPLNVSLDDPFETSYPSTLENIYLMKPGRTH